MNGHGGWGPRVLDLAGYAVGLTAVVVVLLAPVSLLAGAGWSGVKLGLFLSGTLAFGYATLLMWPSRTVDEAGGGGDRFEYHTRGDRNDPTDETPFESVVSRAPLLRRSGAPPVERFHPGTKLYVASLLMLALSYGMEALLGVRA